MKINAFEGARRISLLLQAVWVIGCVGLSAIEEPYVTLDYETRGPMLPFVEAASSSCLSPDAEESIYGYKLKNGSTVSIDLCFKAQPYPDNATLVPYKVDEKTSQWWGNSAYSSDVKAYTSAREAEFKLSKEDEDAAIAKVRSARFEKIWSGVKWAGGGWFAIFILTSIIGWIVRGFFGIPSGKDHRPAPEAAKAAAVGTDQA